MPTSNIYIIPIVIETIKGLKPNSILDFGIGFGKYGFLLREYLDIPRMVNGFSGNLYDNFSIKIDGIEANSRYIGEMQKKIYNKIYIGNGSELIERIEHYDVVLLLDVIEHFTKAEGHSLLKKLYMKTSKTLVVTTPFFNYKQGVVFDNEYEEHKSVWKTIDFGAYKNKQFRILDGNETLMILLHKNGQNIKIPSLRDHWSGRYLIREINIILLEIIAKIRVKPYLLLKKFKERIQKKARYLCQK